MFEVAVETGHSGTVSEIERSLSAALCAANEQAENAQIVLSIRDGNQALIGGLVASTSYGWLLVKMIWVDELHRGSGLGRRLMAKAQAMATARGCHTVWLDTSNPDSLRFYQALGFETFGVLENGPEQQPHGHKRWFLRRALVRHEE